MAPETMVAAVAANTVWKIKKVKFQPPPVQSLPSPAKPLVPKKPLVTPNIRPKPTSQKTRLPTEKSIRFFMSMLTAFLALVKPVSTMAKPACMKNTKKAATHVQTMSKLVWTCAVASTIEVASKSRLPSYEMRTMSTALLTTL